MTYWRALMLLLTMILLSSCERDSVSAKDSVGYALSTSVNGQGTIMLDPDATEYKEGTTVTVTAVPNAGYVFNGWGGDLFGAANPVRVVMDADQKLMAIFTEEPPAQFTLNTSISGQGSIALDPTGGSYTAGTTVTVTAEAAEGFAFTGWSGALTGTASPATIDMNASQNLVATFTKEVPAQYTLNTSISGQGSITLDPAGGSYTAGTTVTVIAEAAEGFAFSGWSGALTGTVSPASVVMDADQNLTAIFAQQSGVTAPADVLAWWPMDENSGTVVGDMGGRHLDLTLNNVDSATHITSAQGNALHFDGMRYGVVQNADALQPRSFTISAHIRVPAPAIDNDRYWIAGHGNNFGLSLEPEGKIRASYHDGTAHKSLDAIPSEDIRNGEWRQVAASWDETSGLMAIYLDGRLVASKALPGIIVYDNGSDFYLGAMNGSHLFKGDIDELRIYGRALSAEEVSSLTVPVEASLKVAGGVLMEQDKGSTAAKFVVSLSRQLPRDVNFDYQTVSHSASAGADFTAVNGTATIPAGSTTVSIAVNVAGDKQKEPDEEFSLQISNPRGAVISVASATFRIRNDDGVITGLPDRPSNTECVAGDRPVSGGSEKLTLSLEDAFPGISFRAPVDMQQIPGDDSRYFVVEYGGKIKIVKNGKLLPTPFLDLSDDMGDRQEDGLYSIAFHPDFFNNGYFYVSYVDANEYSQIDRFEVSAGNPDVADRNTEMTLIEYPQPEKWHNNYQLGFGDDGYLYISMGDGGGSQADPYENAQNKSTLLGAMIRIDVDGGSPYGIPPGNPFAGENSCNEGSGSGNCPEIYAWGLRSPWRWSFDRATQDLWLGDVGFHTAEEVNIIKKGKNYGWPCFEGDDKTDRSDTLSYCSSVQHTAPLTWFPHEDGHCAVTGGYVYRGKEIPALRGTYLYADLCTGTVYGLPYYQDPKAESSAMLKTSTNFSLASFAEDNDGEVYTLFMWEGTISKIVATRGAPATANPNVPDKLSDSRCVQAGNPSQAIDSMIPYVVNANHWNDAAGFQSWFAIPDGTTLDHQNGGDWVFPVGSVLMKNFLLGEEVVETRFMMRHNDGEWAGYTYEWDDDGADATLLQGGKDKAIKGQIWNYPSGAECVGCHTDVAGGALALETAQLNRMFTYPETGKTANQLDTLESIGLFSDILPASPAGLDSLANSYSTSRELEDRARAWLHTNCSSCHQPGGPTQMNMDLRYTTSFKDMNLCNVDPFGESWGVANAKRLAPGDADRSLIYHRPGRTDAGQMPPYGTNMVDEEGRVMIRNWINSMHSCR